MLYIATVALSAEDTLYLGIGASTRAEAYCKAYNFAHSYACKKRMLFDAPCLDKVTAAKAEAISWAEYFLNPGRVARRAVDYPIWYAVHVVKAILDDYATEQNTEDYFFVY